MAVCNVWVDLQIRPIGCVGGLPLLLVAFKLTTVADERCFGGQGQHLGFLRNPVVVHALGIFGISDQTRHVQTTFHLKFVANAANHRNVHTSPILALEHFVTVNFEPFDLATLGSAAFDWCPKLQFQHLVFGCAIECSHVAGVQVQFFIGVLFVEVFRDADCVFVEPLRDFLVTDTQSLQCAEWG